MGNLKELLNVDKRVHLLLTSFNLAEIYVYDTLKGRCNATLDSVLEVDSLSTYRNMLELVNVQPNLADNWLFVIKFSKVKNQLKNNLGIFNSDTSVFLIKVSNYKEFKEAKDMYSNFNDIYLETIRKDDVYELLKNYKISPKVKDFVAFSYYRDVGKVFTLYNELNNGVLIETTKDVVKLCGESAGSIQRFVIQLLIDSPNTTMFLKRNYKKRVSAVYDLCNTFNSRTAYNYIKSTVKDILYIKMLYLEGVIYDRIADLPECFDEKKLAKYSIYLNTIEDSISYSKILSLYNLMNSSGRWNNTQDGIAFLYKYYLDLLGV